jgi:hypothetical protein
VMVGIALALAIIAFIFVMINSASRRMTRPAVPEDKVAHVG